MGILRLFLALSVVVGHSTSGVVSHSNYLPNLPGNVAVEMFFIISGFYMSLVLDQKYRGRAMIFYTNRFLRLWPAFILITIATNVWWVIEWLYFGHPPMSQGAEDHLSAFWLAAVRFSNTFMIGQDVFSLFHTNTNGPFLTLGPGDTLPDGSIWMGWVRTIFPAWSIGTEIWFYLLAPALTRLSSAWLIGVMLCSLLLRSYMALALGLNVYYFFPAQLALFVAGIVAYRISKTSTFDTRIMAAICAISIVCSTAYLVNGGDERVAWLNYLIVSITLGALFKTTSAFRADRMIGELSYPVYLSHMLVISVLTIGLRQLGMVPTGELVIGVTLLVSYLIFRWVEQPIDTYRHSRIAT